MCVKTKVQIMCALFSQACPWPSIQAVAKHILWVCHYAFVYVDCINQSMHPSHTHIQHLPINLARSLLMCDFSGLPLIETPQLSPLLSLAMQC